MVLLLFDSFFLVFECNAIQHTQIGETIQIIFNLGSLVFSLQDHNRKQKNTKKKKIGEFSFFFSFGVVICISPSSIHWVCVVLWGEEYPYACV